jgi:hypothetical protein
MSKFLPVLFCGMAAISYSQPTLAGGAYKHHHKDKDGSAGPGTSLSSEMRDSQGREMQPQGRHSEQTKKQADKSGSPVPKDDAAVKSDSSAAARSDDASVGGTTAEGGASGSPGAGVK